MDFRRRIIDVLINSIYLFDNKVVIYYNTEGGKQVSYMDMSNDIAEIESKGPCSDFPPGGSPIKTQPQSLMFNLRLSFYLFSFWGLTLD